MGRCQANVNSYELSGRSVARKKFLSACCGNCETPRCVLDQGLGYFINFVEARMLDYERATTELLDTLYQSQPQNNYLERQLEMSTKIVSLIRTVETPKLTVGDVASKLFEDFAVSTADRERHLNVLYHLIFAVMGWSTMLYVPRITEASTDFSTAVENLPGEDLRKQTLEDSSRRPLGAMLRNHGLMPIACPPIFGPSRGFSTLLPVTHLNFFSLSRLGDVTISWVDDLSKHCKFDRYSTKKQLSLFRLPSLCAKIYLNEADETLIGRLFKCHSCQHNCCTGPKTLAKSYLIEILLSYRLIFGQHSRSRRLFREKERTSARMNGNLDPLLDALCGKKDPDDFGGIIGLLRERGVYNAELSFPHLGAQLMELEDYSTSQRPRNITEVWDDERDPERLLTFKALIIIGGVSIILSISQVVLAIVQIVVAVRS